MKEGIRFFAPVTFARLERQKAINDDVLDTARHEGAHGIVAMHLELGITKIDIRPQGGGILGITVTTPSSLEKHNAVAMASVAGGHDGTGGDRTNSYRIHLVSEGKITQEQGISIASSILSSYDPDALEIIAEKIAERGAITGWELPGIVQEAYFELRELKKEKKLLARGGMIFEAERKVLAKAA